MADQSGSGDPAADQPKVDDGGAGQEPQPKPTETVEFWKAKARQQEQRAKDNKAAADELAAVKDSQKSEAQKAQDRVSAAEAVAAKVPERVAESLKSYLVGLHQIGDEDAELFLTATEPDLLVKQVSRLMARGSDQKKQGNRVPREGTNPTAPESEARETVRRLFGG